jgi:ABC-type uncharacterized transport system ATPase subunit
VVALDDLSFTVREGQMFGFVGPNGAGKIIAMRIILGVLEPDAGEVRWRGERILGYLGKQVQHRRRAETNPSVAAMKAVQGVRTGRAAGLKPVSRAPEVTCGRWCHA